MLGVPAPCEGPHGAMEGGGVAAPGAPPCVWTWASPAPRHPSSPTRGEEGGPGSLALGCSLPPGCTLTQPQAEGHGQGRPGVQALLCRPAPRSSLALVGSVPSLEARGDSRQILWSATAACVWGSRAAPSPAPVARLMPRTEPRRGGPWIPCCALSSQSHDRGLEDLRTFKAPWGPLGPRRGATVVTVCDHDGDGTWLCRQWGQTVLRSAGPQFPGRFPAAREGLAETGQRLHSALRLLGPGTVVQPPPPPPHQPPRAHRSSRPSPHVAGAWVTV